MRLLDLSLRNYRVFEEVELEFPARVIGIFGPNGSGKTSLVESVAFALYGVDAARTKKNEIRTQGLLTDCEVRLAFEHGGGQYEVRRAIRGRGHTPEAELYGDGLLLASGTTEVEAEVRRLLHMDLPVFRASVFAEQKQLDAFSDVTAGRRKEMALRLLGIRPVDEARKAARREAVSTKQAADQLALSVTDLAALEASLKEATDVAEEASKAAMLAGERMAQAEETEKLAREDFEASDRVRQRVEKLTVELRARTERREALEKEIADRRESIDSLQADLAAIPGVEKELEKLAAADERLKAAERSAEVTERLEAARVALSRLPEVDTEAAGVALAAGEEAAASAEAGLTKAATTREHLATAQAQAEERLARAAEADPSQPCPTCGRPLGDDFAGYLRHCRDEVAQAKRAAGAAERTLKSATAARAKAATALRNTRKQAEDVRASEAERAKLAERVEELGLEAAELSAPFEGESPDLATIRADVRRARELELAIARLRAQRPHLDRESEGLGRAEAELEAIESKLASLAEEAQGLSFDELRHGKLLGEWRTAEAALEAGREAERKAVAELAQAERQVGELTGRLTEARETERKQRELSSDARHLLRTAMLLDGFRDHLVSRVGPELSREAEALFRDLTNREYDDLRIDDQTLSIEIADGDSYHPIERFSGSETDLANLALRVAISTHLSRVSGADLGMLVLDEILGSLDVERKDLFVQAMGRLADRFHQLFVITHAEQVKDQFPAAIEVRKTGRRRSQAALV